MEFKARRSWPSTIIEKGPPLPKKDAKEIKRKFRSLMTSYGLGDSFSK